MKVIKKINNEELRVSFEEDEKRLEFVMGANGDLYWVIRRSTDNQDFTFSITKENDAVYRLFENLFADFDEINVFDDNYLPEFLSSEAELSHYLIERKEMIDSRKQACRECNYAYYNNLYDAKRNEICWYSDETALDVANYVIVKKLDNSYLLEFNTQKHIKGYDMDFYSRYSIPIRFRNSGSRYDPFNVLFMRMYNNMIDIDDVYDEGHQITIDEVLYKEEFARKRTR